MISRRQPSPYYCHPAVLACISDDRKPSVTEILKVAEKIWNESVGLASGIPWQTLPPRSPRRIRFLLAASVALNGRRGRCLTSGVLF